MAMVLQEHKNYVDGNDQIGSMMVKLAVLMGQLLPIGEIVLYVYIFRLLHKANEKAPRLGLSKEVSRIIRIKCICKYFYTQSSLKITGCSNEKTEKCHHSWRSDHHLLH